MRDARDEVDGHGEETFELAEDHLLAGLGSDRLKEEVRRCARVEVLKEAVDTRLSKPSELHASQDQH